MMRSVARAAHKPVASYSMRVVQRLTGLTPDTIRAWERRYGAIKPSRTAGRTRRFTDADVRRLILLRSAVDRGHRVGAIASLTDAQLRELSEQDARLDDQGGAPADEQLAAPEQPYRAIRRQYLDAIRRFDAHRATELLTRAAVLLDRDALLFEIVVPTIQAVGRGWEAGELTPAHEHLVSAQVRALLGTLLRHYAPLPGAPKILLTTPPGEQHELGAIVGAMLAATRGLHAIYLGADLPVADVLRVVEATRARLVVLSVARRLSAEEQQRFATELRQLSARVETWVGLPTDHPANHAVRGVRYFDSFEPFDAALLALGTQPNRTPGAHRS
jgi:DNA-binding transcriptional MerR regulator/methylmalonyl-CoA mutase cobalamin-binding subunit